MPSTTDHKRFRPKQGSPYAAIDCRLNFAYHTLESVYRGKPLWLVFSPRIKSQFNNARPNWTSSFNVSNSTQANELDLHKLVKPQGGPFSAQARFLHPSERYRSACDRDVVDPHHANLKPLRKPQCSGVVLRVNVPCQSAPRASRAGGAARWNGRQWEKRNC